MNLRRKHRKSTPTLAAITLATFAVSCDSKSTETQDNQKICEVNLIQSSLSDTAATGKTISYSGPLSAECQSKTSQLSGRAQINLAAESKISSSSISLQELKAGQRNLQFDAASDNFMRGTFEKRIDSSFYPEWNLPWADKPTLLTLSIAITDDSLSEKAPASIRVELLY